MNKARECDWCGKTIAGHDDRVKLPVTYDAPAFTYHVECYCQVYANRCLRAIISEGELAGKPTVGSSLGIVLRALDPANDEEEL